MAAIADPDADELDAKYGKKVQAAKPTPNSDPDADELDQRYSKPEKPLAPLPQTVQSQLPPHQYGDEIVSGVIGDTAHDKLRAATLKAGRMLAGKPPIPDDQLLEAVRNQRQNFQANQTGAGAAKLAGSVGAMLAAGPVVSKALGAVPGVGGWLTGTAGSQMAGGLPGATVRTLARGVGGAATNEVMNEGENAIQGRDLGTGAKTALTLGALLPTAGAAAAEAVAPSLTRAITPLTQRIAQAAAGLGFRPPPISYVPNAARDIDNTLSRIPASSSSSAPGGEEINSMLHKGVMRALGSDADAITPDALNDVFSREGARYASSGDKYMARWDSPGMQSKMAELESRANDPSVWPSNDNTKAQALLDKIKTEYAKNATLKPDGTWDYKIPGDRVRALTQFGGDIDDTANAGTPGADMLGQWAQDLKTTLRNNLRAGITDPDDLNAYNESLERLRAAHAVEAPANSAPRGQVSIPKLNQIGTRELGPVTDDDLTNVGTSPVSQVKVLLKAAGDSNYPQGSQTFGHLAAAHATTSLLPSLVTGGGGAAVGGIPGFVAAATAPSLGANLLRQGLNSNAVGARVFGAANEATPVNPMLPFLASQTMPKGPFNVFDDQGNKQ